MREAGPGDIARVLRAGRATDGRAPAPDERLVVGSSDDGRPLAGLRWRSLGGALDGRPARVAHLSDPFPIEGPLDDDTGAALQDEALRQARLAGHDLAILIPGTGAPARAPGGFRALPCSEAACRTVLPAEWPKEPGWLRRGDDPTGAVPGLRPGRPEDIDALASIHADQIAGQRLRVDREGDSWKGLLRENRDRPDGVPDPLWVIEREGRVQAYLALRTARPTLRWREHGARKGAENLLPELFWSALGRARSLGLQRIEGWRLPDVLTLDPLYPTSNRRRRERIPLLASLEPGSRLPEFTREDECRLWEADFLLDD